MTRARLFRRLANAENATAQTVAISPVVDPVSAMGHVDALAIELVAAFRQKVENYLVSCYR